MPWAWCYRLIRNVSHFKNQDSSIAYCFSHPMPLLTQISLSPSLTKSLRFRVQSYSFIECDLIVCPCLRILLHFCVCMWVTLWHCNWKAGEDPAVTHITFCSPLAAHKPTCLPSGIIFSGEPLITGTSQWTHLYETFTAVAWLACW